MNNKAYFKSLDGLRGLAAIAAALFHWLLSFSGYLAVDFFGRGRDGSYLPPPAQIRTCGTTAYGSCLGFVTRSVPPDRDVQFWASVCRCL